MKNRSVIVVAVLAVALVLSALVAAQEDQQPFLGIGVDSNDEGALITAIQPDSPAALAGLQTGDIITTVNGTDITADNLAATIRALGIGDTVTLDVLRAGDSMEIQAELAARPAPDANPTTRVFPFADRPYLGISLSDSDNGVVIHEVTNDSPAATAGLQVDDMLVSINGQAVADVRAAVDMIRSFKAGDTLTLEVQRGDETLTLEATLDNMPNGMGFTMPGGADVVDIVMYDSQAQAWQVYGLSENNPLAQAGLQPGDVITMIDGTTYTPATLTAYLDGLDDNANVTLTVERSGEAQEFTVPANALQPLVEFGSFGFGEFMPGLQEMVSGARLGVAFEMVDNGAKITEVAPDSPAADAGLQVDDIVTAVSGDVVDAERTLSDRIQAYEPGDTVTLDVQRGDETLSLDVTLTEFALGEDMRLPFFDGQRGLFDMFPRLFGPDGQLPNPPAQPAQPSV